MIGQWQVGNTLPKGLRNGYKYRETFIVSSIVLPSVMGFSRPAEGGRRHFEGKDRGKPVRDLPPLLYPLKRIPSNRLIHKLQPRIPGLDTGGKVLRRPFFEGGFLNPLVYFKRPRER